MNGGAPTGQMTIRCHELTFTGKNRNRKFEWKTGLSGPYFPNSGHVVGGVGEK